MRSLELRSVHLLKKSTLSVMLFTSVKGASIYDVRREGKKGSRNAANLRTKSIYFADKGGGQTIPKLCGRHRWKPLMLWWDLGVRLK